MDALSAIYILLLACTQLLMVCVSLVKNRLSTARCMEYLLYLIICFSGVRMTNYLSSDSITTSSGPNDSLVNMAPVFLSRCPNKPNCEQQKIFFDCLDGFASLEAALNEGKLSYDILPIFYLDQSFTPRSDCLMQRTALSNRKGMISLVVLIIIQIQQQQSNPTIIQYAMSEIKQELNNKHEHQIKFDDELRQELKEITLDQPVSKTLKRDLQMIIIKLRYAMIPSLRDTGRRELMNWDLWGPFLLTLMLACTLSLRTQKDASTIITSIFFIMWVGALIVFLNANFLGSEMSFFQSACLLGYCLFPLNVASLVTLLVGSFIPSPIKLVIVALSFIWSTLSSIAFIGDLVPQRKRKLALYPICLFYLFLSWFVLIV